MWFQEVASFAVPLEQFGTCTVGLLGGAFATGHESCDVHVWNSVGRLDALLEGHCAGVTALASTPSGDIVSAAEDFTVKVWRERACALTCTGHSHMVYAVDVSPVDGTIVSGCFDGLAKVWSPSTGECVATLEGHTGPVQAVCVLTSGDVVTGSTDKTVRVWERGSWTCTAVHSQPREVLALARLPGNSFAVAGGEGADTGFVSVWAGGRTVWSRETACDAICLISSGSWLAYILGDDVCFVQDANDGNSLVTTVNCGVVQDALVLPDGHFMLFSGWERTEALVLRLYRRSRLHVVDVMVHAWSQHGGAPPAVSEAATREATLAHALSLRRFCRPRDACVELVEPFGRDVIAFL